MRLMCKALPIVLVLVVSGVVSGQGNKPDFPPFSEVAKGYTKVISTADGRESLYTVWTREKDGQMLAQLPSNYERSKYFFAMTVASGEKYAGLQAGDMYVYWKRFDKRLALMAPNYQIRSGGDQESKSSVERLFTDRVILDVPIVAMNGGGPVIDMDYLLVNNASKFFGSSIRISNPRLCTINKAKAFPKNVELAFEVPAQNGTLKVIHYSISEIPENTGYKPRKADPRVGYFTTTYSDYGKFKDEETKVRYINRWRLEKADPSLALSPPKEPIVFYIEHTTPVRYRRWIRQGVLYWNKAFENVGISNAIEVYYQDKRSGAHMDKDPEDVRYNFIRWLSNNVGTAIGPSRVHPMTGQILDADVILTDGWIRHYWQQYHEVMPKLVMEGFTAETLAWLEDHPEWDPRLCLALPSEQTQISEQIAAHADHPHHGHPLANVEATMIGDDQFDGLSGRISQTNGLCELSNQLAFDVALFRVHYEILQAAADSDEGGNGDDGDSEKDEGESEKPEPPKDEPMIDDMPESFVGPMLAFLACHEVGHTLGLRHNFKASSIYPLEKVNSDDVKGEKPFAGSVMDYIGVNINMESGEVQGDYSMIDIGPYDMWAIEYGYTAKDSELSEILSRVAEPELVYATDEDTFGPDPLARRYDFSADPLDYAKNQMRLASYHRGRLVDKFVKEGESWARTRKGYEMTLYLQTSALSTMGNWIGGAEVFRDHKGDKNGRTPIKVVPAEKQRAAFEFVIENTFKDEAFGLTPELLRYMTIDKWWDDTSSILADPTWPVHDRIMGIQKSALTMIMNPTTLDRVYDNEFLVAADEDAFTLPEMLEKLDKAIWTELDEQPEGEYSARKPMISSLRRNLQREYLDRMINLSHPDGMRFAADRPLANLANMHLRDTKGRIDRMLKKHGKQLDAYSRAHLQDASARIKKALNANYVLEAL